MTINIEKIKKNKSTKELLDFGIINIDKSSGPTSFNVSEYIKRGLKLKKTAHFGTLDPKVTGVLPVALNRGCKLTGFFLGEDKEYVGVMRIHDEASVEEIEKAIKMKFMGEIIQLPPVRSRVKREERPRSIYEFEILEKKGKDVLFRVACEGGTYIRKLLTDLGDYMGIGAHMLELRRIRAGIFLEDDSFYPSVRLYDFDKAKDEYFAGNDKTLREMIIPGEIVAELFESVEIKKSVFDKVSSGCPIRNDFLKKKVEMETGKKVCFFCGEKFVGIFRVINEDDIFAKSEFTFIGI